MARTTQRRESQRWPGAQRDERWDADVDDRWADDDDDADDARWPAQTPSRRRQGRLRLEVAPIVNPYSIVSLASALLGLFPVAIVFGFISFGHPRGRVMALFGLLLGLVELTAVAGFVVLSGNYFPNVPRPSFLESTSTVATPTSAAPSPAQPTVAAPNPPPVTTTMPASSEQSEVKKGAACTDAEVGQIGAAADGGTLICLSSAGAGKQWAGPYTVATGVEQAGTKCEGGAAKTARTSDGRAMVCDAGEHAWVLWTE